MNPGGVSLLFPALRFLRGARHRRPGVTEAIWLGTIDAPDEATAIEKAAKEFRAPTSKLIAVQRHR